MCHPWEGTEKGFLLSYCDNKYKALQGGWGRDKAWLMSFPSLIAPEEIRVKIFED